MPNDPHDAGGEPLLLSVREVAALLGVSTRTVYRLADDDRMPRGLRIGGVLRWRRAELDRWIASGCPDCRSPQGGEGAGDE